jgi:hypothetical protein
MTRHDLADDDVLLSLLSASLEAADPVPADAVAIAKALAELSDTDAELATLVADSLVDDEVVLFRHDVTMELDGDVSDRLLSFATPELHVDVDLQANGPTMLGAISPAMSVAIELETAETTTTTTSDELGRFSFEAPSGRCRLRIHAHGGAVVTPWITR